MKRGRWEHFETLGVLPNILFHGTFVILMMASVFAGTFIPHVGAWPADPHWGLRATAFVHVGLLLWFILVERWVQKEEARIRNIPKTSLEEHLRIEEPLSGIRWMVWISIAAGWLTLAGDLILPRFS